MRTTTKIVLGLATLWPMAYCPLFLVLIFTLVLTQGMGPVHPPGWLIVVVFVLHAFTILGTMGLTALYIYNVFTNDRVSGETKILWTVVLFLGNIVAMPIYWYLYIWRDPRPAKGTGLDPDFETY